MSSTEKSQLTSLSRKLIQGAFPVRPSGQSTMASSSESTLESAGLRLSDYHTDRVCSETEESLP